MKTLTLILTLVTLTTLTSCDCLQKVTGTVIDEETSQPIKGVRVQKEKKDHDKDETDEQGKFNIESISGGLFGCPPMKIILSKEGYQTKTAEIDNAEHETIKLQRIE